MKKTLSPIYITIPFVSPLTGKTCTQYTLEIKVWEGLSSSVPVLASYSKTVGNLTSSTGSQEVNVSRLINDFIELTPQRNNATGLISGINQRWVQTAVIYVTSDAADDDVEQDVDLFTIVKGYTYGNEGKNQETPINLNLINYNEFNVNRDGFFSLSVVPNDTNITAISYPDNQINYNNVVNVTTDSRGAAMTLFVNVSEATTDDYIELAYNGVTTTLNVLDECKYTPIDIVFFNKSGAQQFLTFFKEKTDKLTVKNEFFESDRGQPIDGNHQFVRYNTQGRSSFKVYSGFVDEDLNETFRQLLLSDRVWMYNNPNFTPLNVKTSTFEEKTRQKNRLISYEIEFELSYNEINNI